MSSAQTASASSPSITVPRADYDALQAQVQSLKTQLDWFKRQLFGSKSEKRQLLEPAIQADLLAKLGEAPSEMPTPATEQITYTRRTSKRQGETCVTEQGLRFDETVPVEVIELPAPSFRVPRPISISSSMRRSPAVWRSAPAATWCWSTTARYSSTCPVRH